MLKKYFPNTKNLKEIIRVIIISLAIPSVFITILNYNNAKLLTVNEFALNINNFFLYSLVFYMIIGAIIYFIIKKRVLGGKIEIDDKLIRLHTAKKETNISINKIKNITVYQSKNKIANVIISDDIQSIKLTNYSDRDEIVNILKSLNREVEINYKKYFPIHRVIYLSASYYILLPLLIVGMFYILTKYLGISEKMVFISFIYLIQIGLVCFGIGLKKKNNKNGLFIIILGSGMIAYLTYKLLIK